MPAIISLVVGVVDYIYAFFLWLIRKFTVKFVIINAQKASALFLIATLITFYIGILTFTLDLLSGMGKLLNSLPSVGNVSGLFWQVLASSGFTSAVVDAFNVYHPTLIVYFVHMISLAFYKTYKLISDELFKLGVLTMQ